MMGFKDCFAVLADRKPEADYFIISRLISACPQLGTPEGVMQLADIAESLPKYKAVFAIIHFRPDFLQPENLASFNQHLDRLFNYQASAPIDEYYWFGK